MGLSPSRLVQELSGGETTPVGIKGCARDLQESPAEPVLGWELPTVWLQAPLAVRRGGKPLLSPHPEVSLHTRMTPRQNPHLPGSQSPRCEKREVNWLKVPPGFQSYELFSWVRYKVFLEVHRRGLAWRACSELRGEGDCRGNLKIWSIGWRKCGFQGEQCGSVS